MTVLEVEAIYVLYMKDANAVQEGIMELHMLGYS